MPGTVQVRLARPGDGAALMEAVERINSETEFLGVPGEGHPWDGRPDEELRRMQERGYGVILLALDGEAIVGYLSAFAGGFERNRGNIFIAVIGLREAYRGRGIGIRLFEAVEEWARPRRAWRLELRVSSLNRRGQALYRKRGFAIEGTIRRGVLRDGAWTDDFWMGKLLDAGAAAAPPPAETPPAPVSRRHATRTLTLREMRSGDGASFRDWEVRMLAATPCALKKPAEVAAAELIDRDIANPDNDPHLWLVAVQPDMYGPEAIIALGSASIETRFRMQYDAFVNIAVLPEWAGQGLGRRLHDRLEDWARARQVRRLTATIAAPNRGGHAFAAALGYEGEVVMRGSARIDGVLIDRIRLGKLLA